MIELASNISLYLSSASDAMVSLRSTTNRMIFYTIEADEPFQTPSISVQLADVCNFIEVFERSVRQNQDKLFVACVKAQDSNNLAYAAILIGSYMIISLDMDMENVLKAFEPMDDLLKNDSIDSSQDNYITTILDIWRAMHRVRQLGWFELSDCEFSLCKHPSSNPSFDFEMCKHYANPANGGMHVIVPGSLILMPSPTDLPEDRNWMDVDSNRRFSPAFIADLLCAEFSTSLVIRLTHDDDATEYTAAAFEDRGIAVESVPLGPRGAAQHRLLAASDRLIANLRGAPGAVAVHAHGPGTDAEGCTGMLLATALIRVFGFGARDAAAWLRLTCTPPHTAPTRLRAVFHGRSAADNPIAADDEPQQELWRTVSAPVPTAGVAPVQRPAWSGALARAMSS